MVLVEDQFNWHKDELDNQVDDRIADKTFVNLGLDYKNLAFFVSVTNAAFAYKGEQGNFFSDNVSINKVGIKFISDDVNISFIIGTGSATALRTEDIVTEPEDDDIYESDDDIYESDADITKLNRECPDTSFRNTNYDACNKKSDNKLGGFNRATFITDTIAEAVKIDTWRLNFAWKVHPALLLQYSFINRDFTAIYNSYTGGYTTTSKYYSNVCSRHGVYSPSNEAACGEDESMKRAAIPASQSAKDNRTYSSGSNTHALYLTYKLNYKYSASAMLSHEAHAIKNISNEKYIKLALGISMLFK